MSEKNNTPPEITPGDRHPDYKGEIAALLRGNLAPGQLRKKLEDYHERDIAGALELLRRDERCRLYALLDAPTLAGVLEYTGDDMPPISRSWASAKSSRSCRCSTRRPRRTISRGLSARSAARSSTSWRTMSGATCRF